MWVLVVWGWGLGRSQETWEGKEGSQHWVHYRQMTSMSNQSSIQPGTSGMRVGCTPPRAVSPEGVRLRSYLWPAPRMAEPGFHWQRGCSGRQSEVLTVRSGWCPGEEGVRRHRLHDCPPGGPVCRTVRGGWPSPPHRPQKDVKKDKAGRTII